MQLACIPILGILVLMMMSHVFSSGWIEALNILVHETGRLAYICNDWGDNHLQQSKSSVTTCMLKLPRYNFQVYRAENIIFLNQMCVFLLGCFLVASIPICTIKPIYLVYKF